MAKINAEAARWDSLRGNFTIIMWGLLFFLPLPLSFFGVTLDVLAWVLLLIGVAALLRHVTGLGLLWGTAAVGLALSVVKIMVSHTEGGAGGLAVGLNAGTWALVAAFALQLGALTRRFALEMDADDVARSVSWRGWLPLVPMALFLGVLVVPEGARFLFSCAALLITACALSLVMGIPAGAVRLFTQAAKQAADGEGESAEV